MRTLLTPKKFAILLGLNLGLTAFAHGAGEKCVEFLRAKPVPAFGLVAESLKRHHGTAIIEFEKSEYNFRGYHTAGQPNIHVKATLRNFEKQSIVLHEAVHDTTDRKISMKPIFANTIRGIWFKSETKYNLVYALPKDNTDIKIPYGYDSGFQRDERLAWKKELETLDVLQKDLWKNVGFDGGLPVEMSGRHLAPLGKNFEKADEFFLNRTHEALLKLVEGDTSSHAARLDQEYARKDRAHRYHDQPGSKSKEIVDMSFYIPARGSVAGFYVSIPLHAPEGKLPETRELRIQKALQTIQFAIANPFPSINAF